MKRSAVLAARVCNRRNRVKTLSVRSQKNASMLKRWGTEMAVSVNHQIIVCVITVVYLFIIFLFC